MHIATVERLKNGEIGTNVEGVWIETDKTVPVSTHT